MNSDNSPFHIEAIKHTRRMLEQHLEKNFQDARELDDKAKTVISGASLISALITGFQSIQLSATSLQSIAFLMVALLGLIFYVLTIILALRTLRPRSHARPMRADWQNVTSYWHLENYDLEAKLSSAYIEAIDINLAIIQEKSNALTTSMVFFTITIVILISLGFVPK